MHGGDIVSEVLAAHGVKFLFTLVGGHISPILTSSKKRGIRVIDVRHEVTAVFAADAVARLTGVPGVAAVTAGPGLTNTITAVKNAQMAQSPLVLISGAAATLLKGRGALQDIDQLALLRPIVKYHATCWRLRDIAPTLRTAFHQARSGTPGPVFVELPIDILYPIGEVRANMGLSSRIRVRDYRPDTHAARLLVPRPDTDTAAPLPTAPAYVAGRSALSPLFLSGPPKPLPALVSAYLRYKLRFIFAGAWDHAPTDVAPLPVQPLTPSPADVSACAALLRGARSPVVLVGSQAMVEGGAEGAEAVATSLRALGVPCFLGGMARGLLGKNSPLHVRQQRRAALKKADVVIMAGMLVDFRLDYGRSLSRNCRIVAVNREKVDLKKNTDLFWTPTVAAHCDPALFLHALAKETKGALPSFTAWAASLKTSEAAKEENNAQRALQPSMGRGEHSQQRLLNPLAIVHALEEVLDEKSILIGDGGDFVATAAYVVRPTGPLRWLDPGAFGTLGVGGGFALGAALARPDHDIWLVWGDGSAGYSIAEVDTFARHGLKFCALIGNDACWTQIEREQVPMLGDDVACPLNYCRYEHVSRGYGGLGFAIQPTAAAAAAEEAEGESKATMAASEEEDTASAASAAAEAAATAAVAAPHCAASTVNVPCGGSAGIAAMAAALRVAQLRARGGDGSGGCGDEGPAPVVVNALMGGSNFREGSLSV